MTAINEMKDASEVLMIVQELVDGDPTLRAICTTYADAIRTWVGNMRDTNATLRRDLEAATEEANCQRARATAAWSAHIRRAVAGVREGGGGED